MSDDFTYDVFISYSHQDATWVRGELLRQLKAAGLKVCIDYHDFRPGAPSVSDMERAVLTSRHTLLVLTPAFVASEWTEFEALMRQTLSPSNRDLRLIPLLKEKCELPARLKIFTYVNFADPESAAFVWRQLLTALGAQLPEETTPTPMPANWFLAHPYPASPHFTGRNSERRQLSDWLSRDAAHPLLLVRALGGFGKSALSWHWLLHDVEPRRWQRVVWWSFYEGDASFEHFLSETLDYLKLERNNLGSRQQVDALLAALRNPNLLLVLDGFERQLRAFSGLAAAYQGDDVTAPSLSGGGLGRGPEERQCISPLAEQFLRGICSLPGMQGKVVMTTRLRPSVVETHGGGLVAGCQEIELRQMQPEDAVALFRALGVRGNRNEIESACEPYGYHPLSLRLLAGLVINDLQTPGDIAAAQRLHLHKNLVQRQHHVLEQAYNDLTPERRKLLSRIACFRFGMEYKALQALAEQNAEGNFEADLRDLLNRGLLQRDPHS